MAVHLPGAEISSRARQVVPDLDGDAVVHCWGPGCNESTKAALALLTTGHTRVRELVGGVDYWVREGLAVETETGRVRRGPDDPTAVVRPPAPPAPSACAP